ncbi:MAG: CocE/NonD family hydrolase [Saprospiraceae bacterium]|nr:CocE/NonD family hydrolase [Saprospiraceae bacterium]
MNTKNSSNLLFLCRWWVRITLIAIIYLPTSTLPAQDHHDLRIMRHQAVEMRDGVRLFADVYLPEEEGAYPTIVVRTPYGVQRPGMHQTMVNLAQHGYAVVLADVRGRYESEGRWDPFRDEAKDGYDIIEWAAVQPFSNGKVGLQGGSYLGHNQWAAASQRPPHLEVIVPRVASTNIYANWLTMGGAFRLSFNFGWGAVRMPYRIMLPQFWHQSDFMPENLKYENVLMQLPLSTMDEQASHEAIKHYRNWLTHQSYDEYWKSISDEERFDRIEVPAYTMGGWFDIFVQGTVNGFVGMRNQGATTEARQEARMMIGPWGHGVSQSFGGWDFGPQAVRDASLRELQFFDYHLKGNRSDLIDEKPVQIFYMGANKWQGEDSWPIPGTIYQEVYLNGGGNANSVRGDGTLSFDRPGNAKTDTYFYDPKQPVSTVGGNNCCGTPTLSGPRDQRPMERREDVLVYTSKVLEEPVTIAGNVKMRLYAATDGKDTDWMIKLVDVQPDGYAFPVSEGILRARFRQGLDNMQVLTPNEVYAYDIELMPTANVFLPGHRIRIDITSSNFPQFNRNPNTGEDLGASAEMRVARQTIHHGGERASHILLPTVHAITMD